MLLIYFEQGRDDKMTFVYSIQIKKKLRLTKALFVYLQNIRISIQVLSQISS